MLERKRDNPVEIDKIRRTISKGDYERAVTSLNEMLKKDSKSGELNYLLAFCLQQLKIDLEKAMCHYNLAIEYGFQKFWVLFHRGSLYYILGDCNAARADLERAVTINPDHHGAKRFLEELKIGEVTQLVNKSSFGEALPKLKELLCNNLHSGAVHYLIACCFHNSDVDYTKALEHYDLALEYGYDEFWVRYNRGLLYVALSKVKAARADLERAVSINPDNQNAKKRLHDLLRTESNNHDIVLPSPILVSCIPKSGTMLLKNILRSILGDHLIAPPGDTLATNAYIKRLPRLTNKVYYGHVWNYDDIAQRVRSLPKIILVRDPRDVVLSLAHFLERVTDRHWSEEQYELYWHKKNWDEKLTASIFGMSSTGDYPPSVLDAFLNYALRWVGPKTLFVRYEDLIGSQLGGDDAKVIRTVQSILTFIGVRNIEEDTLAKKIGIGVDPTKSITFRSANVGGWRKEFKPSHVKQMKVAAPGLVSSLGYEPNENWGLERKTTSWKLPDLNIEALKPAAHRTLQWNEYLHLRGKLAGTNELNSIVDGWALNIFIATGQLDNGFSILNNGLLASFPDNARLNYLCAICHVNRKDFVKALQYYDIALRNGFDEFYVRFHKGRLLKELGDLDKARLELQRAIGLNPEHEVTRELLKDLEKGVNIKQTDYKEDFFCVIDTNIEEVVRLVNNRIFDTALVKLQELLKTRLYSGTVHYLTGYCLHSSKIDYTKALNHYDLALEYGYDEYWLLYARGSLYYRLRDFEKARVDLERAALLNHDPVMTCKISQIIEELEIAQAQQLIYEGSFGEALAKLRALLDIRPKDGRIHYFTGFCLNLKTEYKKALEHYSLALEYGYDEFRIRRSRSYLYRAMNNFEAAIADLERARSIDPHDQGAREALERLRILNSTVSADNQIVPSPVLVNSVPKSGTMLLYNMLISILGDRIVLPATIFDIEPFRTEYLKRTSNIPNRVYWGHVSYSDDLSHRLSSIPKIILIRDPRDNAVSLAHFLDSALLNQCTKREYEEYWGKRTWEDKLSCVIFGSDIPNYYVNPIMNFFLNHAVKWAAAPNTFFVRYEDIVGSQFGGSDSKVLSTIKSIMDFIGVRNVDEETLAKKIAIGADPAKSTTFRSGGVGSWRYEFTPTHVNQMKIAAPNLVSSLGYEPDENWDITDSHESTAKFQEIDMRNLANLASKSVQLDWNRYLELHKEFVGELKRSNLNPHPFDEWALNIFNESQQSENAMSVLENYLIVSIPDNPKWNYYYAFYLHILRKDLQKALYHYNLAFKNGFDEFWVRYNRGILLKELGYGDDARIDLKRAAELNPHFEAIHKLLQELERERNAWGQSQQIAIYEVDKVQKLVSNLEYHKASLLLQELLEKFPTDARLNYMHGFCLHVMKKDLEKALYSYNVALQNGFDEFWIKYNRGSLLFSLGNVQGSITDLERAIVLKPDHKGALETLGQVRKVLQNSTPT